MQDIQIQDASYVVYDFIMYGFGKEEFITRTRTINPLKWDMEAWLRSNTYGSIVYDAGNGYIITRYLENAMKEINDIKSQCNGTICETTGLDKQNRIRYKTRCENGIFHGKQVFFDTGGKEAIALNYTHGRLEGQQEIHIKITHTDEERKVKQGALKKIWEREEKKKE